MDWNLLATGIVLGITAAFLVAMAWLVVKWHVEQQVDRATRELKEYVRERERER